MQVIKKADYNKPVFKDFYVEAHSSKDQLEILLDNIKKELKTSLKELNAQHIYALQRTLNMKMDGGDISFTYVNDNTLKCALITKPDKKTGCKNKIYINIVKDVNSAHVSNITEWAYSTHEWEGYRFYTNPWDHIKWFEKHLQDQVVEAANKAFSTMQTDETWIKIINCIKLDKYMKAIESSIFHIKDNFGYHNPFKTKK